VVVAASVSFILFTALMNSFFNSNRLLSQSTGRLELVQACRIPVDRLQQIISTAVCVPSEQTILYPENPGPGKMTHNERGQPIDPNDPDTWTRYLVMRTTEEFLADDFNANEIYELATMPAAQRDEILMGFRTDAQRVYDFIVWYEDDVLDKLPDVDRALVVGQVQQVLDGSGNTVYRPRSWAGGHDYPAGDPWADLALNADGSPRVRILAQNLDAVTFFRAGGNGINVSVRKEKTVQAQTGEQKKVYRMEALLQIPTDSDT
jgi:hypothetical protein